MQKLSNKQSAKVICRFHSLRTAHSKSPKAIWAMEYLSASHAFDYIVLRVNPGLTSCNDLAMVVVTSYNDLAMVWAIIIACGASYFLPFYMYVWNNKPVFLL